MHFRCRYVWGRYMVLLVCGLWEPLRFLYWIQLIGTSAMVLVGYCLLARILSLMPWNLREPLSSNPISTHSSPGQSEGTSYRDSLRNDCLRDVRKPIKYSTRYLPQML